MGAPIHTTIQGICAPNMVTSLNTKLLKAVITSLVMRTNAEPPLSCAAAADDIASNAKKAPPKRLIENTLFPRTARRVFARSSLNSSGYPKRHRAIGKAETEACLRQLISNAICKSVPNAGCSNSFAIFVSRCISKFLRSFQRCCLEC